MSGYIGGGGSGIGGSTGATDNSILRADGTGGSTLQAASPVIDDSGNIVNVIGISGIGGGVGTLSLGIGTATAFLEEEIRLDGSTGNTILNGGRQLTIGSAGVASPDVGIQRQAGNIIRITDASTGGGAIQFIERTDPSAPAANNAILYSKDNGSGKTQLVVRFPTGAVQVIATEP